VHTFVDETTALSNDAGYILTPSVELNNTLIEFQVNPRVFHRDAQSFVFRSTRNAFPLRLAVLSLARMTPMQQV